MPNARRSFGTSYRQKPTISCFPLGGDAVDGKEEHPIPRVYRSYSPRDLTPEYFYYLENLRSSGLEESGRILEAHTPLSQVKINKGVTLPETLRPGYVSYLEVGQPVASLVDKLAVTNIVLCVNSPADLLVLSSDEKL